MTEDWSVTIKSTHASALASLVEELQKIHGSSINTVLYYGSRLRSDDPFEGVVDLYLIVDSYSAFYPSRPRAILNWLLPPDVFYREFLIEDQAVRVKYNVLSINDLRKGLTGKWFHPYLWGRFVQPVEQIWCRSEYISVKVSGWFNDAVRVFLDRVLPMLPGKGQVSDIWQKGLQLSYAAELRSESTNRAEELVAYNLEHYVDVTRANQGKLSYPVDVQGEGREAHFVAQIPEIYRSRAKLAWWLRRMQGKVLSIGRLLKGLFTFEGGLDYVAWKISRHSGQLVEIPDRVRRYPLIFIWHFTYTLYRRGIIK